jgi:hypothetical protein
LLVAGGDELKEAGFDALALFVGDVQAYAQLVGGVLHADLVEGGDSEQLDVPLGQRASGIGERGQKFAEEDAEVLVGRTAGHKFGYGCG